jgi:cell division protein ZapA
MAARPVELRVGGQSYRVVSSASAEDLERLAAMVDEKLTSLVPPGKPLTPQSLLLVAMALANDLETERARFDAERARADADRARGDAERGRTERVRAESKRVLTALLAEVESCVSQTERALSK